MDDSSQLIQQRREKAKALLDGGISLYPNDFKVSHTVQEVWQLINSWSEGQREDTVFSISIPDYVN